MSEVQPQQPQKQKRERSRNWVFTCNNYEQSDEEIIQKLFDEKQIRYYCYGKEVGEQGTHHLQGYLQTFNPKDFNSIKKTLGNNFHIEKAKGSPDECVAYCKKDGHYTEKGEMMIKGQRTDLKELVKKASSYIELVKDANNLDTLALGRNVVIDYYKQQQMTNIKWDYEKKVIWLAGPTGCGKSKFIQDWAKERDYLPSDVWYSSNDLKWFDGYNNHKITVFDDFRKESCSFSFLLRLLDRYYLQVPIKGGFTIWQPEYIFITCPRIPQFEFVAHGNDGLTRVYEDVDQINRRCETIMDWNKDTKEFDIIK